MRKPKSAILEEKPTTPIENILQTEPGAWEFYRRRYMRLSHAMKDFKPVTFHQMRLDKQHFCWTGVRRYWIWNFPPIRLFINNQKGVVFEVSPDLTVDEALDAFGLYEEVMGITYQPVIRPSAEFRLWWKGKEAAVGHEMRFPRLKKDELRDFVLRFSDGHIWTSRHVKDIGMVFMPVIFGCLSIPDSVQEKIFEGLMDNPGLEPEMPEQPKMGELPVNPDKPDDPEYVEVDPEEIEAIKSNIDWQDTDSTDIDAYKASIESQNAEIRSAHEEAIREWEANCEATQSEIDQMMSEHEAKAEAWEKENAEYFDKHAKWVKDAALWGALMKGVGEQFHKDLGCIWADEEKHHHPRNRYVNGCPSFTECCLMHREDFNRAMQAAGVEMKRREKIQV